MNNLHLEPSYLEFISEIKSRYQSAQLKAASIVNTEVIQFYWQLGKDIIEKQTNTAWGSKFLEQLSIDLQKEFQGAKGFSKRNLQLMRQFAKLYPDIIAQQAVAQLPWGHIAVLIQKVKDKSALEWYALNTLQNNISRDVLIMQIEQNLYERQGKNTLKVSNFYNTLPKPQSDLALQMLKNPYNLDFLTIGEAAREKEVENELVRHISKFLTELGVGFAYMGQQYKISTHGDDYWLDLLFKCLVYAILLSYTYQIPVSMV
ncbi:MAG TPA: PDDEXK nuclease domain-containing protein [Aquella sp.]|nr:PDDEXK nuclease domain-containing protein [Aquella sp.]